MNLDRSRRLRTIQKMIPVNNLARKWCLKSSIGSNLSDVAISMADLPVFWFEPTSLSKWVVKHRLHCGCILHPGDQPSCKSKLRCRTCGRFNIKSIDTYGRTSDKPMKLDVFIRLDNFSLERQSDATLLCVTLNESDRSRSIGSSVWLEYGNDAFLFGLRRARYRSRIVAFIFAGRHKRQCY